RLRVGLFAAETPHKGFPDAAARFGFTRLTARRLTGRAGGAGLTGAAASAAADDRRRSGAARLRGAAGTRCRRSTAAGVILLAAFEKSADFARESGECAGFFG